VKRVYEKTGEVKGDSHHDNRNNIPLLLIQKVREAEATTKEKCQESDLPTLEK
jgi:hypothetical protein